FMSMGLVTSMYDASVSFRCLPAIVSSRTQPRSDDRRTRAVTGTFGDVSSMRLTRSCALSSSPRAFRVSPTSSVTPSSSRDTPCTVVIISSLPRSGSSFLSHRQSYTKRAAFAKHAVNRDVALVRVDDAIADRQPESGSHADPFRRESRIEDARQMFGTDA